MEVDKSRTPKLMQAKGGHSVILYEIQQQGDSAVASLQRRSALGRAAVPTLCLQMYIFTKPPYASSLSWQSGTWIMMMSHPNDTTSI